MVGPGGVCISLGAVVLDRPDQTGVYIAKDLAGGWAYLVADAAGDHRCRGQGVCGGGLDVALRCAFLSASHRVSDSQRLGIVVESRQAHRAMARLAVADLQVAAAIAGRPVAIMTRPEARSMLHVRAAAERAAASALQERARAEWPAPAGAGAAETVRETALDAPPAGPDWRRRAMAGGRADRPVIAGASLGSAPIVAVQRMLASRPSAPRNVALTAWLTDFDSRMASVSADLQDVGA
jgi:hypothetical protein